MVCKEKKARSTKRAAARLGPRPRANLGELFRVVRGRARRPRARFEALDGGRCVVVVVAVCAASTRARAVVFARSRARVSTLGREDDGAARGRRRGGGDDGDRHGGGPRCADNARRGTGTRGRDAGRGGAGTREDGEVRERDGHHERFRLLGRLVLAVGAVSSLFFFSSADSAASASSSLALR